MKNLKNQLKRVLRVICRGGKGGGGGGEGGRGGGGRLGEGGGEAGRGHSNGDGCSMEEEKVQGKGRTEMKTTTAALKLCGGLLTEALLSVSLPSRFLFSQE